MALPEFSYYGSSAPRTFIGARVMPAAPSATVMSAPTVLGAGTGGYRAPVATAPAPAPAPAYTGPSPEELQRQQVDRVYGEVFSGLDRQAGLLPGMRDDQINTVNQSAQLQQQGIQGQKDTSLKQLDSARQGVRTRQATSVRDLAGNMRNLLQAGNTYLGNAGAGDSSAAGLYNYAISKEGTRAQSDLLRQANEQYGEIDMKQMDIEQTATDQINQINLWKNDSLGKISSWFNQQLFDIENRRGEAKAAKEQAKLGILENAMNYLRELDSAATQYQQQVGTWATERMAQINNAKIQMGQMGRYDPRALVAQELQGMNGIQAQGIGSEAYNPYAIKRNQEQQRLGKLFG